MTNHARLNSLITKALNRKLSNTEDKELNILHHEKMEALSQGLDWEVKHLKKK